MAGKLKHFQTLDGRHYTRIAIPSPLRSFFDGKRELRHAHGDSLRLAHRDHPAIVAGFYAQLDDAKGRSAARHAPAKSVVRERPMSLGEYARSFYSMRAMADRDARDASPVYAGFPLDEGEIASLRRIAAGLAGNDEIARTMGGVLDAFSARAPKPLEPGSVEWRSAASRLAGVELDVFRLMDARSEGEPDPTPTHALLTEPEPAQAARPKGDAVSILGLLSGYLKELAASGRGAEAGRRWTPGFKAFVRFLGHDDARLVAKSDVILWKDTLLETHAAKTVRDTNVAALRAVLQWAVDNERLATNPAAGVKVRVAKKTLAREKGFTLDEALAVLTAARDYAPAPSDNPATRESEHVTAAKRWTPWLCAFSGARISEMTQLRKQDVRTEGGVTFLRITPEAGSVKTGVYRDVPVHPQLAALGFLDFVNRAEVGPLFYNGKTARRGMRHASKYAAQRMATWVRSLGVIPDEIDPNHGWRHRFKTVTRELGVDARVVDAMQGHAARTAGEDYGDITLAAKAAVMSKMPAYDARDIFP